MTRRVFSLFAILVFAIIFADMVGDYSERQILSDLAEHYLVAVPRDLGGANVVTGILITFRGFDTLGEVAVLFMVAASVGILLGGTPGPEQPTEERRRPSELVENGSKIILPLIFLFGGYVIMNGHLSAGGGFQGGAVVASGVMLMMLAQPASRLDHGILSVTEFARRRHLRRARHLRLVVRGRISRQPHPAEGGVRDPPQRRCDPGDFGAAWHQGRGGAERRHRPVSKLKEGNMGLSVSHILWSPALRSCSSASGAC